MFTHLDDRGRGQMVDVSEKDITVRRAKACGSITMKRETVEAIRDAKLKKGDVLAIAQVAAIQGAKATPTIIPLAHPLLLQAVHVEFELRESEVYCEVVVTCQGKTGVEMEALTACSCALLTVYDMCKAIDKTMVIKEILLLEKSGGRSGDFSRES